MANNHDWLSLVHLSGLLVSEPVLNDVFSDGPPALEGWQARRFRAEYERWLATQDRGRWTSFILSTILGYDHDRLRAGMSLPPAVRVELTDYMQTLSPDRALMGPDGEIALLVYFADGSLDKPETQTGRWKASPFTKLDRLLRATSVPLGLLTNGDDWRLVYAEANLPTASIGWAAQGWFDERVTLGAFTMLLGADRFAADAPDANLLALIRASQERQMDVADQLGEQVRAALWTLIDALDEADRAVNGELLREMSLDDVYEMAIKVMMRLLFLLYAEEHRLLPHGEVFYDQAYGLTYLAARLQRQMREDRDSLSHTHDAWPQLLATFRLVHDGVQHSDFTLLAYGGALFDPRAYPVLEDPRLSISNATVNRILTHLLLAEGKVGRERVAQRVSYRSLDVEQFGYMYEGLLDHVVKRATEPMLALQGTKDKQPEVPLRELEARQGDDLIAYLREQTGRSASALRNALAAEPDDEDARLLWTACDGEETLYRRVLPYANLLLDKLDPGMRVILPGRLYVTEGPTRRATGTHYTPVTLTGPIVQHTLKPLVYHGPAEGLPREEWTLRTPRELLDLKICDMAMGSGAFLVQACRHLAGLLDEAWGSAEAAANGPITPLGEPARKHPGATVVPTDQAERDILAKRLIADRCLYGVDKNPLAVEMAKLSLWLITLDKHRPFTFLDHALKAGDSLVGVSLEQLEHWNLDTSGAPDLFAEGIRHDVQRVIELRRAIARLPVDTIADLETKRDLLFKAETRTHTLRTAADLLVASYFNTLSARDQQALRDTLLHALQRGEDIPDEAAKHADLGDLRPFHWELEFPEVFLNGRGGFDAFIGNPPFIGGMRLKRTLGAVYQNALRSLYVEALGNADLVVYFFLRAFSLLSDKGCLGLIATKTISEGDSRESALAPILNRGATIYRAETGRQWSGSAHVLVAIVHLTKRGWNASCALDGQSVEFISSFLTDEKMLSEPRRLVRRRSEVFMGSAIVGDGFLLEAQEAATLLKLDPRNSQVVQPYITGKEFVTDYRQRPTGWVINFAQKTEAEARLFPACWNIVEERVKPFRMTVNRPIRRKYWWRFGEYHPALYHEIAGLSCVLANARVAKHLAFEFLDSDLVYLNTLYIYPFADYPPLGLLQSSIFAVWALSWASSVGATMQYTPSDCYETFPFPDTLRELLPISKDYHTHRRNTMDSREEGLTATYNRFHDQDESAADIAELRRLHVEMDCAVAAAYGWDDLDLGHGFHETRQGVRYTISEPARREVLTRLLALNHARYAEEVAAGLHDKKSAKGKGKKRRERSEGGAAPSDGDELSEQQELFDDGSPKQRRLL